MFIKIITIFIVLVISIPFSVNAGISDDYESYISQWDQNIYLAKKYMAESQKELEMGDALLSCINQRKASKLGIIATKSKIKAMQLIGNLDDIDNLEKGLQRWKIFGDFCK